MATPPLAFRLRIRRDFPRNQVRIDPAAQTQMVSMTAWATPPARPGRGQFPDDAPATLHNLTARTGQISPAGLIDRHQLRCQPVRDLLVDYLTERQPTLDYTSLKMMASHLAGLFWADLEHHRAGIDSLRLPPDISDLWKTRVSVKAVRRRRPDGTTQSGTEPRQNAVGVKQTVRAFYLDIAQWALTTPLAGESGPHPVRSVKPIASPRNATNRRSPGRISGPGNPVGGQGSGRGRTRRPAQTSPRRTTR